MCLDDAAQIGRFAVPDHRLVRSKNDRTELVMQRIAKALGIPVEALLDDAASGLWLESKIRVGEDTAGRAPGGGSLTSVAHATESPDHDRQAAEMQTVFDRVRDPAEREACLSFVRARAMT